MVDSWRNFLKVEMFWAKLALMDAWETFVFCAFTLLLELIIFTPVAGAGKSVLWYVNLSVFSLMNSKGAITKFVNYPGSPRHVRVRTGIARILLL